MMLRCSTCVFFHFLILSFLHSNDGQHTPRLPLFLPVGEKTIIVLNGAMGRNLDLAFRQADGQELAFVGGFQVEIVFLFFRVKAVEIGMKVLGDLFSDLVGTLADAGADVGAAIFAFCAECFLHFCDRFADDFPGRTPPAGVDGGHGPVFGVVYQNGRTIGNGNAAENIWPVRHQSVVTFVGAGVVRHQDLVAVYLEAVGDIGGVNVECREKSAPVFPNVLRLIFGVQAEI